MRGVRPRHAQDRHRRRHRCRDRRQFIDKVFGSPRKGDLATSGGAARGRTEDIDRSRRSSVRADAGGSALRATSDFIAAFVVIACSAAARSPAAIARCAKSWPAIRCSAPWSRSSTPRSRRPPRPAPIAPQTPDAAIRNRLSRGRPRRNSPGEVLPDGILCAAFHTPARSPATRADPGDGLGIVTSTSATAWSRPSLWPT